MAPARRLATCERAGRVTRGPPRTLAAECIYNLFIGSFSSPTPEYTCPGFRLKLENCCARGRPIIVEWERRKAFGGPLSRSVTHRYVTERYTFSK
ncbi:hypothetical protein EVAR_70608_1 [Eumeta japonica]|uniref:Uncharacterized protein n=1 Tax=Eumeta variegata TaxID=151549 RepID=A0A4C2A0V3_EUMVA|nr:hypothetical protein EVAR_70608_1 [Eumeta japonica]